MVVAETPGLVCVDARNGFVQPVLDRFRDELMSRARRAGICRLQIRNSHHFAALWPDLEPFATRGLVAFACVNSKKRMAGWSGGAAVLGTTPWPSTFPARAPCRSSGTSRAACSRRATYCMPAGRAVNRM
ncbi:Ldh family oxidoreductase [Aquamicrobium sp.]|uniref:Ldh family oxidoreductase n=1 Tax=Aquamicrobium sp. TaxID=1872579 RepID=UPI00349E491E